MIRALLTRLDLAQRDGGIRRGGGQHLAEQLIGHKVGAGTGGQIAAPGKQLHGPAVDLPIAPDGRLHRLAGLGEGRRVQNNKVIVMALLLAQLGEQVEHIGALEAHPVLQPVAPGVFSGHVDGGLGDVHTGDVLRSAHSRVQAEGAGVGKAVQHPFACGDAGHCRPIILLVEEEAGLLSVLHIHQIAHAVFHDLRYGTFRGRQTFNGIPALALLQSFPEPDGHIVSLVDAPDVLAHLAQNVQQGGKHHVLHPLHAQGEHLHGQDRVIPIHRQAGHLVGLAVDQAAALEVGTGHDRSAVAQGVLHPAAPEGGVKPVIGAAGDEPNGDLGGVVVKTGTQIGAARQHIHQTAVLRRALHAADLLAVHPRVASLDGPLRLVGDIYSGITALLLHRHLSFQVVIYPDLTCKLYHSPALSSTKIG